MPPLSNPQKAKIVQLRHQGLGVRRTWIKLGELWPDVKFNQGTVGKWWHRAGTQFQQECNLQRKVHTSAISQDCRPITMHEWLGPILCTIQILCTNPNLLQHRRFVVLDSLQICVVCRTNVKTRRILFRNIFSFVLTYCPGRTNWVPLKTSLTFYGFERIRWNLNQSNLTSKAAQIQKISEFRSRMFRNFFGEKK